MRKFLLLVLTLIFMSFGGNVRAIETGWRRIYEISCGIGSAICGAKITGLPAGPEDCQSNVLRWMTDDAGGAETLLLVATAFYSDKYVNFVLDEECFAQQMNLPSVQSVKVIQ